MAQLIRIELTGRTPLLVNNEQQADPLNPIVVEKAKYTAIRTSKRTLADHAAISRLEWYGALYLDPSVDTGPVMPTRNIKRSLRDGAQRSKLGVALRDALIFNDFSVPIVYDGPRDIDELFKLPSFHSRLGVGMNSGSRIMKTRPQFPKWSVLAEAYLDETILDITKLCESAEIAGRRAGLGDGREINFGRYSARIVQL